MPRIPLGDFGNAVAAPTPVVQMPSTSIGPGLQDLGRGMQALSLTKLSQQRDEAVIGRHREEIAAEKLAREREQQVKDVNRAKATRAMAGFEVDALDEARSVVKELAAGTMSSADAPQELAKRTDKLREKYLPEFSDDHAATFDAHYQRFGQQLRIGLDGAIVARGKDERAANISGTMEALDRLAVSDPDLARRRVAMLSADGAQVYGAARWQDMKEAFSEQASFNHLGRKVEDAATNTARLKELGKVVRADKYLSPEKQLALIGKIDFHVKHLEVLAASQQAHRDAMAQKANSDIRNQLVNGFSPAAQDMASAMTISKGTPFEAEAKALPQFASAIAALQLATPQELTAAVNGLEAATRASSTPQSMRLVSDVRQFADAQIKQQREDPQGYAETRGIAPPTVLNPDAPDFAAVLQQRAKTSIYMTSHYGSPAYLAKPDEAKGVANFLGERDFKLQAATLGIISSAIANPSLNREFMKQLGKEDLLLGVAGDYQGQRIANAPEMILRGRAILRDNQIKMPDARLLDVQFRSVTRTAFDGHESERQAALETAKAIYAVKASDDGITDGVLAERIYRSAVRLAVGGVAVHIGGHYVLPPYGMLEDDFMDRVHHMLKREGLPVNSAIENTQGGYFVRNGSSYWPDPTDPTRRRVVSLTSADAPDAAQSVTHGVQSRWHLK